MCTVCVRHQGNGEHKAIVPMLLLLLLLARGGGRHGDQHSKGAALCPQAVVGEGQCCQHGHSLGEVAPHQGGSGGGGGGQGRWGGETRPLVMMGGGGVLLLGLLLCVVLGVAKVFGVIVVWLVLCVLLLVL